MANVVNLKLVAVPQHAAVNSHRSIKCLLMCAVHSKCTIWLMLARSLVAELSYKITKPLLTNVKLYICNLYVISMNRWTWSKVPQVGWKHKKVLENTLKLLLKV